MTGEDIAIPTETIPETGWGLYKVDTKYLDGSNITFSFYAKGDISVMERDAWVAFYTTQGIKPPPYSTEVRLASITPRIP